MSHSNIFEIRKEKRFSDEEIENGVMDVEYIQEHYSEYIDYISGDFWYGEIGNKPERETCIQQMLMSRIDRVFHRSEDVLTLSQQGYDTYVSEYVKRIKKSAETLTPHSFSTPFHLQAFIDILPQISHGSVLIYDEQNYTLLDWREWLISASTFQSREGDGRKFYIGKVWDYHC